MKAWTIGAPIAIVLFLTLLVVTFSTLRTSGPRKAALDAETAAVITALRERIDFIPPTNDDKTFITLYTDSDLAVIRLRIHGVPHRPQQDAIITALRTIRTELNARPIVIRFLRPEVVTPDPAAPESRTPSFTDDPRPLREERV